MSFQMFKLNFEKAEEPEITFANICWIIKKAKAREFQKKIYFCFINYAKAFDCVDQNKLWKILQEMGIPDHLTCLPRNLYAGTYVWENSMQQLELDMEQQSWIFIGRTDAEAEALILQPPDAKNSFIGKDSDAEKE